MGEEKKGKGEVAERDGEWLGSTSVMKERDVVQPLIVAEYKPSQ